MSDEQLVPATLEAIVKQIEDLRAAIDTRFDDLKSQLRVEIEAVRSDVKMVYEAVIAQDRRHKPAAESRP